MAMTKEQIKEATKAVIEAKKAIKAAQAVLEAAQAVFTDDYRSEDESTLLQEVNIINVDGELWELRMNIEEASFQQLQPAFCTAVII